MNDKNPLHFDFLLDSERWSSSQLRLCFIVPVLGVVCLLAPLVVWIQESSQINGIASSKQLLDAEIASLNTKHEVVLKARAEEKELTAQLQQLGFYRTSKNAVGATLANLTNCVSSRIQLTELRLLTQTAAPISGPQVRPKNVVELAKLCPSNQMEEVTLRLAGRSIQPGDNPNPVEVNRFLQALQAPAFSSLVNQKTRPKVSFQGEAASFSARPEEGSPQEVVSFEIIYECLPRRFQ
jgi:Tfp pilus assembly protein PilN